MFHIVVIFKNVLGLFNSFTNHQYRSSQFKGKPALGISGEMALIIMPLQFRDSENQLDGYAKGA
jgi:hypothetical protein